jgi:hypothetical protein
MKRLIVGLMALVLFVGASMPALACNKHRGRHAGHRYERGSRHYARRSYYDYRYRDQRSFWQKHRDKLTLAIGTGSGAAVGGLAGGKSGAAIGALLGAGGSALYTYKLRKRLSLRD